MTAEIATAPATSKLRALRLSTALDAADFAEMLDLAPEDYRAMECGARPLPTAKLPALARALDAPLASVVATLLDASEHAAELHTLAHAFARIPNAEQREALLGMALSLAPD